jgi:hypothetical protein
MSIQEPVRPGRDRGEQPAHEPHVAMKDSAFDWGFDDLGQFDGDVELWTAMPQPREPAAEQTPTLH